VIKLAELKVRCGIDKGDTADHALLELLEADAVAHFERATNLYFGPVIAHTEIFSGGVRGTTSLVRTRAPIVSLTSVELLSGTTWTAPWVLADFDASGFIVGYTGGYFPAGRRNLRLTYQGGYVAGTEPADVRAAIGGIVAETFRDARRSSLPVEEPQRGSLALAIPGSAQDVIARWYRSPGT
jgi:hypothetical protein